MSSNNKWNFSTPRVDETGPASVHGYIISISSAKPDWWIVKRLSSILKYCNKWFKKKLQISICTILLNDSEFYSELQRRKMVFEGTNTRYGYTFRNAGLPEQADFHSLLDYIKKITFRTQTKDDWRNSFTFSKLNKLTLPERLLFSSLWNKTTI